MNYSVSKANAVFHRPAYLEFFTVHPTVDLNSFVKCPFCPLTTFSQLLRLVSFIHFIRSLFFYCPCLFGISLVFLLCCLGLLLLVSSTRCFRQLQLIWKQLLLRSTVNRMVGENYRWPWSVEKCVSFETQPIFKILCHYSVRICDFW